MLVKKINSSGQKAYQRNDNEDRSLVYRNWIRTINADGYFVDVDFIKWRNKDGELTPVAITELTRCDSDTVSNNYLQAIVQRYFVRDAQGRLIQRLSDLLNVPAYLILFQKEMKWLQVYSFKRSIWRSYTPLEWSEYLRGL